MRAVARRLTATQKGAVEASKELRASASAAAVGGGGGGGGGGGDAREILRNIGTTAEGLGFRSPRRLLMSVVGSSAVGSASGQTPALLKRLSRTSTGKKK